MTTTIEGPIRVSQKLDHPVRTALVALVVVLLIAGSFIIGHVTASTVKHVTTNSPAVTAPPASAPASAPLVCHLGRAC